jgi:osmotically-inducible protein OsmY
MKPTPLVAAMLAALPLAACDRQELRDLPARAERQIEKAIPAAEEATLTAKVKAALIAAPDVSGLDIRVETSGKVVTLTGVVGNDDQRTRAEQAARHVQGVEDVVNHLAVGAAR